MILRDSDLERIAVSVRRKTLEMIYNASGGHTGGSLPAVDILVVLYHGVRIISHAEVNDDDRFQITFQKNQYLIPLFK